MKSLKKLSVAFLSLGLSLGLTACPSGPRGAGGGGGGGGGGGQKVNPGACGAIDTSDAGRKLYAFLEASARLQTEAADLEARTRRACEAMGRELGVDAGGKDTSALCNGVAEALKAHMTAGLKAEASMQVTYKPAVCTVNAQVAAQAAAKCEGKAEADVAVQCEGTCSGTCNGDCAGNCSAQGADGKCAGTCDGACNGTCSGGCQGGADVEAEAQCEASGEVRANADAECTPAEVDVKYDGAMVVDKSKLEAAERAIKAGLPDLLVTAAKAKILFQAVTTWSKTAQELARSSAELAGQFGMQAACVSGQIAAAANAAVQVETQVSVSVEASASVSGAAGASAG